MNNIEVRWRGPYSLISSAKNEVIYGVREAETSGIYLWAIRLEEKYLINYVGIASKNIADRQDEHLRYYLAGEYSIYDPKEFAHGRRVMIYQPSDGLTKFLSMHKEYSDALFRQLESINVFFTPIVGDRKTLERVESSIIEALRSAGGVTFQFLDNMRLSCRIPHEQRSSVVVHGFDDFEGMPGILCI